MRKFDHYRAESFQDAAEGLRSNPDYKILAGGTDILTTLKDEILETSPKAIIDLSSIPNADYITEENGTIKIGAMAKLSAIAENETVKAQIPGLAEAAVSVATPLVRNLGTIGGNLCQDVRCWYYRYPHEAGDRLNCRRKGGDTCYAIKGKNRYHSVFGGMSCSSNSGCKAGCPGHTDIPAYMEQIRKGNIDGAARIIMNVNPMPMITGRVCAHFCQDECNQNNYGDSVSIRNVERCIGDYILANKDTYYAAPAQETGKKVAIVGAGPAGLSAAFYLRKAGNDVTVYDAKEEPGGMLMYAIPAYRLPKDIVRELIGAYKAMGIKFVQNTRIGVDVMPAELEEKNDSVLFATGAWKRPVLGLNGEELTVFGLDFLGQVHDWMQGKIGQEVLVTGGGNVAMDVAVTAKRLGAKKVIMACLESEAEMPASKGEIARAREEGIEIMPSWGLSKVVSKDGKVTGMELKKCVSVKDENGRFNPQYDENELTVVSAENILMAVGQKVDLSFLDEKYQVQLSNRGLIDVNEETQSTSREGIFAAGDATTGPKTIILAIANGHAASNGMNRYLGVKNAAQAPLLTGRFLTYDVKGIENREGLKLKEVPLNARSIDVEDEISATAEEAKKEAGRCMNCGCYSVAPSDIAPMLIAADATIVTTEREVKAAELFGYSMKIENALNPGELVTEIKVPAADGAVTHYDKFRLRESIDWAIAALGSVLKVENGVVTKASLCLGGVAPVPYRLDKVNAYLLGKKLDEATIQKACEMSLEGAMVMSENQYKIEEIKTLVKNALLRVAK